MCFVVTIDTNEIIKKSSKSIQWGKHRVCLHKMAWVCLFVQSVILCSRVRINKQCFRYISELRKWFLCVVLMLIFCMQTWNISIFVLCVFFRYRSNYDENFWNPFSIAWTVRKLTIGIIGIWAVRNLTIGIIGFMGSYKSDHRYHGFMGS